MTQEDVTQLERRLEFTSNLLRTKMKQNQLKMKFSFILDTKIGVFFYLNLINRGIFIIIYYYLIIFRGIKNIIISTF